MMRAGRVLFAWVAGAFIALSAHAGATEPAQWRPVDAETGKIRDIEGLEQLAKDFPESGNVRLRLLQPYLEAGDPEKVLETLEWLYDRGYVFGEVPQEQIPKLLDGVDPGRIAERLRAEAEIIEASELVATIPAEAGLVESVRMLDPKGIYGATSITNNSMFVGPFEGLWSEVELPFADDVSGLVNDTINNTGWFTSGNVDRSRDEETYFSGLIGMTGGERGALYIAAPKGVTLSDIAVGPDRVLYASDPLSGGVYRADPADRVLTSLVDPGTLRSPQGIAIAPDNIRAYVSDYHYGVAVIDLATREVSRLASDIPILLDGIDGLWLHQNELIAVQNGTSPMRISAFKLSDDGARVIGYRVLEQAHPEWTEPLGGSIHDDALIYVATGRWDLYIEGQLAQGEKALPTEIRRLPLGAE